MILVINAGSSSIKFKLFEMQTLQALHHGLIEEISDHHEGFERLREELIAKRVDFQQIKAIGHRVVHGGEAFNQPTLINTQVIQTIKSLIPLAPLHNPANLEGIYAAQSLAPDVAQIAVFDTAFHQSMPQYAYRYPLENEFYKSLHVRRYGFHGTSHHYVAHEAAKILKQPLNKLNLITLHIGNGVSACAIEKGKSVDTSMGMTPLEGLMMGTRSGSIDPAIVTYLMREGHYSIEDIDTLLNKKSGLLAIGGASDMRTLLQSDTPEAHLAIAMFTYRLKKQIGAYMAVLGEVDALVFTGGIGEHSEEIRSLTCKGLERFDLKTLVIATDEELQIALHVKEMIYH
ncbi:MAG: acetate kinase [Campylobacterota bacterium]|nr:acetate kinase [Campylobacterota bacterium]